MRCEVEIAAFAPHPFAVNPLRTSAPSSRLSRSAATVTVLLSFMLTATVDARGELSLQRAALSAVGKDQGIYAVAEDGTVLAAVNETRPIHPASVSKIATTLALLDRLGPDYRFETRFAFGAGPPDGTIDGDLVVEASGDPFFIFESALLVLAELRRTGISTVKGDVRVQGRFLFNWQPDPTGARLKRTLSGHDGADVWPKLVSQRTDLEHTGAKPGALRFDNGTGFPRSKARTVLIYRSPRLQTIMKALNCYSNNVFHPLSEAIGGPKRVESIAREQLPDAERNEVTIDNAAGAGLTNRMSPRAAVALVRALEREAVEHRLTLTDLLPVAGVDEGTLRDRVLPDEPAGAMVGKTGTYGSIGVSALAGVIRTKLYGDVTFAVLNRGLPVAAARQRQDAFVHAIMSAGEAIRLPYSPESSPLAQMHVETSH